MSEYSRFFDSASYTEAQFAEYMKKIVANDGIIGGLTVIEKTPLAMQVHVNSGEAFIQGVFYQTTGKDITITAAHATLPRIDRIVLQVSWAGNTCVAMLLGGTASATPTAPALTQTAATWEVSLAQVYVGAAAASIAQAQITDERTTTNCGIAACLLGLMHIEDNGNLDANYLGITNLATPTLSGDAVNKAYADTKVAAANAALTGVPTAPTAAYGTHTTQIATAEFVQHALPTWQPFSPTRTWGGTTPVITANVNRYAQLGDMVFITIYITHASTTGSITGLSITGIPGTPASGSGKVPFTAVRLIGSTYYYTACYMDASSATLTFPAFTASTSAGAFLISGFYEVS